jgi:hypothetical protein
MVGEKKITLMSYPSNKPFCVLAMMFLWMLMTVIHGLIAIHKGFKASSLGFDHILNITLITF